MRNKLVILAAVALLAAPTAATAVADTEPSKAEQAVRALFAHFTDATNAHDSETVSNLIVDSPEVRWAGPDGEVRGHAAALESYNAASAGAWSLTPDINGLAIVMRGPDRATITVPASLIYGPSDSPAQRSFVLKETAVRTQHGWRIAEVDTSS